MQKTRVMVVDDSAVVRQVITATLARERSIEVLAAVADPIFAMQRMRSAWPDVIVLDVEMPRMDGITFLRKIMAERPTPVVICSSLTVAGAETTMQALAAGAVTIVAKPKAGVRDFLLDAHTRQKSDSEVRLHHLPDGFDCWHLNIDEQGDSALAEGADHDLPVG